MTAAVTLLRCADQAELRECSYAIIETNFRNDLAALKLEDRRSGEPHFAASGWRKRSHQEIAEGRSSVRTAAFPTPTT
jgi:hypothetical protein